MTRAAPELLAAFITPLVVFEMINPNTNNNNNNNTNTAYKTDSDRWRRALQQDQPHSFCACAKW